jgi:hypothetical protein
VVRRGVVREDPRRPQEVYREGLVTALRTRHGHC